MRTRQLGNSELEITPIGFGAWAAGGGNYAHGWGHQDDNATLEALARAIDHGINWIDTAPVYGLGHSEEVVGRFIAELGSAGRPYIFTKCGHVWNQERQVSLDLSPASIRREVEDSLKRLRVDVIDLYQIHKAAYMNGPEANIEEAFKTMVELQKEGKVRYLGVSNFSVAQMERVAKIAPITSLQPPYSLARRGIEAEILPYCIKNNIGVINYSPMEAGMFSGAMTRERIAQMADDEWRRTSPQFTEPNLTKNLKLADLLGEIAEEHHVSTAAVAIAWTLRHPGITGAIVGARSGAQVDGFIAAAKLKLSERDLGRIQKFE